MHDRPASGKQKTGEQTDFCATTKSKSYDDFLRRCRTWPPLLAAIFLGGLAAFSSPSAFWLWSATHPARSLSPFRFGGGRNKSWDFCSVCSETAIKKVGQVQWFQSN